MKLLVNTGINNDALELVESKQLFYGPIYSLGPLELEMLKDYIETLLKTIFIWLSKSLVGVLIFFDKKPDSSLCLYKNHPGLNNLRIKNWYPLPLIGKSLDWLGYAKRFTQLDLISTYH